MQKNITKASQTATVQANNAGWLSLKTQTGQFFKIQPKDAKFLLKNDTVTFTPNGELASNILVIKRPETVLIGKVKFNEGNWQLVCDDSSVNSIVYLQNISFIAPDLYVAVKVDTSKLQGPVYATLYKVLGTGSEPFFLQEYALAKYALESVNGWKEIQFLKKNLELFKQDVLKPSKNRKDLTDLEFFTIDSESTRDIDDALYLSELENGALNIKVAIADVSHFVRPLSALDESAKQRGSSVYLADKVYPMLPVELSESLLSLVADEVRFAVVCDIVIDKDNNVTEYSIYRASICSKHKLTYKGSAELVSTESTELPSLVNQLKLLASATKNYISSTNPEKFLGDLKISFTNDGFKLNRQEKYESNYWVEFAMLLANECAAKKMASIRKGLWRVQSGPSEDDWTILASIKEVTQLSKDDLCDKSKAYLSSCLDSAFYHYEPLAHYSLNKQVYCHFTSPIRRYTDIVVHRLLLGVNIPDAELQELANLCTERTRQTKFAEKFYFDVFKKKTLEQSSGSVYDAQILSVTEKGARILIKDLDYIIYANAGVFMRAGFAFNKITHDWVGSGVLLTYGSDLRVSVSAKEIGNNNQRLDFDIVLD